MEEKPKYKITHISADPEFLKNPDNVKAINAMCAAAAKMVDKEEPIKPEPLSLEEAAREIPGFHDFEERVYHDSEIKCLLIQYFIAGVKHSSREVDFGQLFDNNFNCYADTQDEEVFEPAMTKEVFLKIIQTLKQW